MPSTVPSPIIPKALPKALPRQDARPVKAPVARIVVPPPKPAGLLQDPIPPVPELLPPTVPSQPAHHTQSDTLSRSQRKPVTYRKLPTIHPSTNIDIENIDINKTIVSNEFGDMVYWYSTTVRNHEHKLTIIETSHFMNLDIAPETQIPKDFWKAMAIP
jgi:hypothetical protein